MEQDILRLKAFEEMLEAVQKEYRNIVAQMESQKAAGKVKSATYRQLMGRKMTYQNMLSLYELYNLAEKTEET